MFEEFFNAIDTLKSKTLPFWKSLEQLPEAENPNSTALAPIYWKAIHQNTTSVKKVFPETNNNRPNTQGVFSSSVREFCYLNEPQGDLGGGNNLATVLGTGAHLAIQGIKIHSMIQESDSQLYQIYHKEVNLQSEFQSRIWSNTSLHLKGRADAVLKHEGAFGVQEIKATLHPAALVQSLLTEPWHPYVLQGFIYCWLIKHSKNTFKLEDLSIEQSYFVQWTIVNLYNPDSRENITFYLEPKHWDLIEFWVVFQGFAFLNRHEKKIEREIGRKQVSQALQFPFHTFRNGQKEALDAINESLGNNQALLLQAPTGLGKTVTCLFPNLKSAMATQKQVFYITPKNSQNYLPEEVVKLLRDQKQDVRSVTITAKEKMCLKDEVNCHPDYCEYAKGYYTKLSQNKILERLSEFGVLDSQIVSQWGRRFEVCPFELSLDLTAHVDVIIGDYNYVFSPNSALARYFEGEIRTEEIHLVVDEAHNLYSRAMELYSPSLSSTSAAQFMLDLGNYFLQLQQKFSIDIKKLNSLSKKIESALKSCFGLERLDYSHLELNVFQTKEDLIGLAKDDFIKVETLLYRLMALLVQYGEILPSSHPISKFQRTWIEFCRILELEGDCFKNIQILTRDVKTIKILCCDASSFLSHRMSRFASVTLFSATLKPFDFFKKLSGISEIPSCALEINSPFPAKNTKLLIVPQISTLYQLRAKSIPKIAGLIKKVLEVKKGNYFLFFPSYQMLNDALKEISKDTFLPDYRIHIQKSKMSQKEIKSVLEEFRLQKNPQCLFAVQGGVFSEGIDLPGDALIASVIFGPGLPTFDLSRRLIKEYYDKFLGPEFGFTYAYIIPGMIKVIQSAGRVIRSPEDQGLIILCDHRFLEPQYQAVMPKSWLSSEVDPLVSSKILEDIRMFWRKHEKL